MCEAQGPRLDHSRHSYMLVTIIKKKLIQSSLTRSPSAFLRLELEQLILFFRSGIRPNLEPRSSQTLILSPAKISTNPLGWAIRRHTKQALSTVTSIAVMLFNCLCSIYFSLSTLKSSQVPTYCQQTIRRCCSARTVIMLSALGSSGNKRASLQAELGIPGICRFKQHMHILVYLCACSFTKSCLTLCIARDSSPPGSFVYGISQARI